MKQMKKNILTIAVLLVAVVSLTGCGSKDKKLTCTVTSDKAEGALLLGDSQKVEVTFKDDKASKISMEMTLKAESKEEAEEYKTQYDQLLDMSSSSEYVKTTTKVDGTSLVVISEIEDISKLSEEDQKDAVGEDITYDGLKKSFEEQGYTCK